MNHILPEPIGEENETALTDHLKRKMKIAAEVAVLLLHEMEDRFGTAPVEVRQLVELMRLKTELRRLKVLGLEASRATVTLHLRDDTPLDPVKVGALVGKKKSPYRLAPDGRLTRRALEQERAENGLVLADRMLSELAECVRVTYT